MPFNPNALQIGDLYTRPELSILWGYKGHEAISKGVVTPVGEKSIILFVTREKQRSSTQYQDYINGEYLHWEGEERHSNDLRISTAEERGEDIYLFYRDIHHTPFRYYGRIFRLSFIPKKSEPSQFVFELEHDLSPSDDISQAKYQLDQISQTERDAVIRARVGQGKFREDLFDFWKGCAITNIQKSELLRASHIKPWRKSENQERLNPFNGLLLLPQYDHLFDRGYITFDKLGKLIRSKAIEKLPSEKLGIDLNVTLRNLHPDHRPFLEYHQEKVFLYNSK